MGILVYYFANLLLWQAREDTKLKNCSLCKSIPAHAEGSTVETCSSTCEPYGKHTVIVRRQQ